VSEVALWLKVIDQAGEDCFRSGVEPPWWWAEQPAGFVWICNTLGIDPDGARRCLHARLVREKPQRIARMKTQHRRIQQSLDAHPEWTQKAREDETARATQIANAIRRIDRQLTAIIERPAVAMTRAA
jgi:hypothetical protein